MSLSLLPFLLCKLVCLCVSCFILTVSRSMFSVFSFAFPEGHIRLYQLCSPCVSTRLLSVDFCEFCCHSLSGRLLVSLVLLISFFPVQISPRFCFFLFFVALCFSLNKRLCFSLTSFCLLVLSYTRTTYRLRLIKNVWISSAMELLVEPELGIFHVIVFPRGHEDYVHGQVRKLVLMVLVLMLKCSSSGHRAFEDPRVERSKASQPETSLSC